VSGLGSTDLREEVLDVLVDNGYTILPSPLQLGEISLDIDLVCSGPTDRLDLVGIADRPETREEGLRLYWQIQRLARALDAAGSRRTITVVVVGGVDDPRLSADLQTVARILAVDDSLPIRRLIAPLLTLKLPAATQTTLDGIAQVRAAVKGRHSAALLELVQSAADGPDGVTAKYLSWVDESFPRRRPRGRHG